MQPLSLLQVVPALEGPADEWDVIRVFVIGLANDARVAMRAAAIMAQGELLQGENAPSAASQFAGRRRTHAADTDDDHVKRIGPHRRPHHIPNPGRIRTRSSSVALPSLSPGDGIHPTPHS